jgi:hypothetical protein
MTAAHGYHAFGLIGTALSKIIRVFQSSSLKAVPMRPNAWPGTMRVYYGGCSGPFEGSRACALGLARVQKHGWAGLR